MRRRILTFMLVPSLGGFIAMFLFLMQGGFVRGGGAFTLAIGFFEMPSLLLLLPASDVLSWPGFSWVHDFLIIVILTIVNVGFFAAAGFMSWMLFPSRRTDLNVEGLLDRLDRAGWSIQHTGSSAIWVVTGVKGEMVIRAEDENRTEAFRRVYGQAAAVDTRVNTNRPSTTNFLFAFLCIIFGHLCEGFFGWIFFVMYAFASIHGPGVQGTTRQARTLEKILDPRGILWGTLFLLAGIIGGLLLIFTGCFRLAQAANEDVPTKQERPSSP